MRENDVRDKTSIVGVGATDFSRSSGRTELRLAVEASLAALGDAGLRADEIDGVVQSDHDNVHAFDLAATLGITQETLSDIERGRRPLPAKRIGRLPPAIRTAVRAAIASWHRCMAEEAERGT